MPINWTERSKRKERPPVHVPVDPAKFTAGIAACMTANGPTGNFDMVFNTVAPNQFLEVCSAIEASRLCAEIHEHDDRFGGRRFRLVTSEQAKIVWSDFKGLEFAAHLPPLSIPQAFEAKAKPHLDILDVRSPAGVVVGKTLRGATFALQSFIKQDLGFKWLDPELMHYNVHDKKKNMYFKPLEDVDELHVDLFNLCALYGLTFKVNSQVYQH